jgi:hypothetical protein
VSATTARLPVRGPRIVTDNKDTHVLYPLAVRRNDIPGEESIAAILRYTR